jgi:electron transport complex protein RnfG
MKQESKTSVLPLIIMGLKLMAICAVAAFSLSLLNMATESAIEENSKRETARVVSALVKEGEPGELGKPGDRVELTEKEKEIFGKIIAYYPVKDKGKIVAFIVESIGKGYGGELVVLGVYLLTGEIVAAQLMDNKETPGLGKKAEDPEYMNKFLGTGTGDKPVPVTKEMLAGEQTQVKQAPRNFWEWLLGPPQEGQADTVSGATLTFFGVSGALEAGSDFVKDYLVND